MEIHLIYIVYFIVIVSIFLVIIKLCLKLYEICGCDNRWVNAIIMSMESTNNELGNANVHFVNNNIDPPAYSDNFNSDPPAYSDLSVKAFITIVPNNSDPPVYSDQNNVNYSAHNHQGFDRKILKLKNLTFRENPGNHLGIFASK